MIGGLERATAPAGVIAWVAVDRGAATGAPLRLNKRITTTKKTGTNITPSNVADVMPPMTAVPSAFWAPAPAPFPSTMGSTPRMNAIEVIKMGRNRR